MADRQQQANQIGGVGGNGRAVAYALAVASFFALGFVVYRDDPGDPAAFTQLSPQGRDGYRLWREQNCHTCHQLYGFGGYLGPDLTHVARRVTNDDFYLILHAGVGPMPRIDVSDQEVDHIYAFLKEMDKSGNSYPGAGVSGAADVTWDQIFSELKKRGHEGGADIAKGIAAFEATNCKDCHQPFRLGRLAAPDLMRVYERVGADEIEGVLRRGRGNMPSAAYLEPETPGSPKMKDMMNLLRIMSEHRAELKAALVKRTGGGWDLPWWRYGGGTK